MKESRFQVPTPLRAREAAKPSRAMASTNEINAKNLVKKADGFMKPSMLRWKPDFDKAIELYEEAARAYRGSNNFVMAADAEERSAEAHTRLDDYWHAAKALERGTEALARCEPVKGEAVLAMAERACESYALADRGQAGAEALGRAAKGIETKDPKTAVALLRRSVEVFSEEGKDTAAHDHHRRLSAILLHMGEYQDAADACMKYAESCSRAGQMHSLSKAYLSAIIALLYDGDGLNAQAAFNDIHEVPGFDKSEEREVAYKLLSAYRESNIDNIKYAIESGSCVRFLDFAFARLATRLPNASHDLGDMARKMGVEFTDEGADGGDDLT